MTLFKKRIELDRFLHHAIAATFASGLPIAQVDPLHELTAEQRIRAAGILRVRSLVAHYCALLARVGQGVPVDALELGRRYEDVLWHVLVESTRSWAEAERIAREWETGVEEVITRVEDWSTGGAGEGSNALDVVSAATVRVLERALETDDYEYCRRTAARVTEHSVRALSFALTEVKLVS